MFEKMYKRSYSQLGEDMIINHIFVAMGIIKPSYLDIGAHDPFYISNTAFFYEKGSSGINIEPNPVLFEKIDKTRKRDINLNIGIGEGNEKLDFYVMNSPTMSTFSKEQAEKLCENPKFKIERIQKVDVKPIMSIIEEYCAGVFPDFLSLDAEGLDFSILKTIDYSKSCPKVICVESVEYSETLFGKKEREIIEYLENKGYYAYADTGVNSILVKR